MIADFSVQTQIDGASSARIMLKAVYESKVSLLAFLPAKSRQHSMCGIAHVIKCLRWHMY